MAKSVHPEPSKNFGEPIQYDPDFRGPNGRRSCTDILCLCLFIVFIFCWIVIGAFAMMKGNPDIFFNPRDSNGKRCGYDVGLENKPYLFFFDLTKCVGPKVIFEGCKTPQICVEKCPNENFMYASGMTFDSTKNYYCKYGVSPRSNDLKTRIDNNECPKWFMKSKPVGKRCLPKEFNEIKGIVSVQELKQATKNIKYVADAEEVVASITEDLVQSWWKILIGLVGAMVFCLMYIILLRWIAGIMVWISIIGVIVILSVGVYLSAIKYKSILNAPPAVDGPESTWEDKNLWLAILIITAILLAICLLLLLFLRKRILIAIALIKEASKAVSSVTSTLFFPICPWALQILILAYAIAVGLHLNTIGSEAYRVSGDPNCKCSNKYMFGDRCEKSAFNYECSAILQKSTCNLACTFSNIEKPSYVNALHAYNIIGAIWTLFFTTAFGEMVLATTFATWYWTFKKSDVPYFTLTKGIVVTLRYHLGTLAFGSLIITICRLIRIVIEYIDHKLKKYDNPFVTAMMCCCKCFFWCLEKFLKFINKNAYIMCAIHGKNFCTSAKDAFNLLMRNLVRVFVVDKVTDMLLFLAKLLVTASVSVVAYTAFTNGDFNAVNSEDLHYVLVPVVFIALGTFLIASVFFGVYSMAVDTLFLCFLEDCERNDGSPEKPYFMSKRLMRILGKKNKKLH